MLFGRFIRGIGPSQMFLVVYIVVYMSVGTHGLT